jgi:hypothetical protein
MSLSALRFTAVLLASCALLGAEAVPTPALPLKDGERLTYRVSWALLIGAGEIKIDARHDAATNPRLIVKTSTATRGWLTRRLMPFDARSESIFDLETGKLLSLHEITEQRDKVAEHAVTFDYATRKATYAVPGSPAAILDIPPGNPVDLIMGLLQTRSWNLKEGEKQDALVLFKDDFYELTIHAARYEDVTTPLGTFRTLVLEPRMDKTPPKGMFKRGSSVRVWISQDERRLPVRFEVEFNIGTGTATLEAYTPPSSAQAPAAVGSPKKGDAKNSGS